MTPTKSMTSWLRSDSPVNRFMADGAYNGDPVYDANFVNWFSDIRCGLYEILAGKHYESQFLKAEILHE